MTQILTCSALALCIAGAAAHSCTAQAYTPPTPALASAVGTVPVALPDAPAYANLEDEQQVDAHAAHAGEKGHTSTGEPQQTKRILGISPNFSSVSANEVLPPLSSRDKFELAARNSFDYSSFLLAAVQAGFAMNSKSYPQFHQGVAGYGRYYWHTLADTADENAMVGGILPVLTREDPRFYTLGHGSFARRALYASTRILQTRTDGGGETVNFSEIIGAGAAAGVSSLYYPTVYRTWTKVGQKWLTSAVIDSANYTFKEFWPDINHKVFHTH